MFFRRRGWTLLALICLLVWLQADVALAGPPIPVKPVITGQGIASPGAAVPAADPEKEAAKEKESAVTVKVQGAFGNHAKQGAWLPLQVDVTNKGPDIKGKLRVVNSNQEQYLVDYTTNAVVPQGSTKRFTLNVPINEYAGSLKVELVTEKGVVAKGKMDLTFHSFDQPVIGLLDRSYNSEAVFQFEIPEGRFEEMNLYLQSGMPYFSETSLYNWEKQTWEKFQVKAGSNNIKDYGKYLNKNRQLRFMMRSNRDGLEVWGLSISLGSKDGGKK